MLVNPPPHLTHALSSMYKWNATIHEKGEREGKFSSQGGGFGGCLIGPSVSAQCRYYGFSWNPPFITSFLLTFL